MTPEQQAALEGLAGRALAGDEYMAIDALLPIRNDVAIAAALPKKKVFVSTEIGPGTILAVLSPHGGDFLNRWEDLAQTDANAKWLLKVIERGVFDAGNPVARQQLTQFAAEHVDMADGIKAILALGERHEPINFNSVSDALNKAEGRLTL